MNLTVDNAEEISVKHKTPKPLGRILLKVSSDTTDVAWSAGNRALLHHAIPRGLLAGRQHHADGTGGERWEWRMRHPEQWVVGERLTRSLCVGRWLRFRGATLRTWTCC